MLRVIVLIQQFYITIYIFIEPIYFGSHPSHHLNYMQDTWVLRLKVIGQISSSPECSSIVYSFTMSKQSNIDNCWTADIACSMHFILLL